MVYVALASRCVIGAVFAVSLVSKLRSRTAFREFAGWLASLPVLPPRTRRVAAVVLAAAETAVLLLVALPWTVVGGLAIAAVLLMALTAGVAATMRAGTSAPCQCFGRSGSPLSSRHVVRNLALSVLAAVGAVAVVASASSTIHPAGLAVSLGAAAVVALVVLFMDDLAALMNEGAFDALSGRRHRPALPVQPGTHASGCQVDASSRRESRVGAPRLSASAAAARRHPDTRLHGNNGR
jgi:hypothetical protein